MYRMGRALPCLLLHGLKFGSSGPRHVVCAYIPTIVDMCAPCRLNLISRNGRLVHKTTLMIVNLVRMMQLGMKIAALCVSS